ncbi:MAG TPA: MauE/DoxX family redox-associated membrane protein [Candidatus Eremiobacteraceae bacterium]|nr:MauE/DoxX family redox-associated membrane protein [Candidatus Eremiobacteraceae bacterium]
MSKREKSKFAVSVAAWIVRLALGSAFLVSVADRFGVLGPHGARNVSWGDWQHFVAYVAILNWFVPSALASPLAIVDTIIESALGIALMLGLWPRLAARVAAGLLLAFAVTMTVALGIVAPVSYGVFSAFGGALLLATVSAPGSTAWSRRTI